MESTSVKNKKSKTRRGYNKSKKRGLVNDNILFNIIGTNAGGLNLKKESFFQVVSKFNPSVVTVQETKL